MNPELEALLETFRENEFSEFAAVGIPDPFVRSPWTGDTLLHFVATWGDLHAAQLLVDAGVEIDLSGEDDFTPLHTAISHGHLELAKFLLSRGANPAKKCMFGTGFEMAATSDKPGIAELFTNGTPG